jgi:hypothetical protein
VWLDANAIGGFNRNAFYCPRSEVADLLESFDIPCLGSSGKASVVLLAIGASSCLNPQTSGSTKAPRRKAAHSRSRQAAPASPPSTGECYAVYSTLDGIRPAHSDFVARQVQRRCALKGWRPASRARPTLAAALLRPVCSHQHCFHRQRLQRVEGLLVPAHLSQPTLVGIPVGQCARCC